MRPTESIEITCPSCGESLALTVDCSIGPQEYIQDCELCCRPMLITTGIDVDGEVMVAVRTEDE